jgi:hypothetical protein
MCWTRFVLAGIAASLAAGCGTAPPSVTEAEGVVLLNGVPLPKAQVEFAPDLAKFGAEFNSSAVTDDRGRFQLKCANGQDGAAIASHRIVVTEGPVPEKLRGMSGEAQTGLANYLAGLKNRPIPPQYGAVGRTPLRVEVKAGEKEYKIELTR